MATIHRITDRIKIEIDDVIITIAPLSYNNKKKVMKHMMASSKGNMDEATLAVELALKYSLKSISNVFDVNGEPYQLEFENNELTNECLNEIQFMEIGQKIQLVCSALIASMPSEFTDGNGKVIEGIKILSNNKVEEQGK